MAEALVIRGLSKRFGGLRAVQDVSFTVKENETVALIGPNGAGKTTSFNLITGFHRPDSGSVSAYGREIVGLEAARHLRARPGAHLSGRKAVWRHDRAGQCHDRRVPARQSMPRWRARKPARRSSSSAFPPGSKPRRSDLTTIDQRRLEMARALATQPRLSAARRSHGRTQPGGDRSGGRVDRKAVAARPDHRHRRARDARHHGRRAPHRGARSRAEDRGRHAKADRRESGSGPRLSGLLRAPTNAGREPSAQAIRCERQLRLGSRHS